MMIRMPKDDDIRISESLMGNPPWALDVLATIREYHMALESDDEDIGELLHDLERMGIDPDGDDYAAQALGAFVGVGAWAMFMAMAFADAAGAGIDARAAIMAKATRMWEESQE